MTPFQRIRVVSASKDGREPLVGMHGTVRRVVTHRDDVLAWVEMDNPLPAGMEIHGPLESRFRWVLMDKSEIEGLQNV